MTTVYLVRHGEYENPHYLFPGRLPGFPLTEKGREQIRKLTTYFRKKPIATVYSSPSLRTKQSAEILGEALDISIHLDDRLLEVATTLDGTSMNIFDANPVASYTKKLHAKGAESMEELAERMHGIIEEKRREHDRQEIIMMTHGDPMRFAVMYYRRLPYTFSASRKVAIPLAAGYKVVFDDHDVDVTSIP